MGLPITLKKEALSEAYVRAVVAKAGYNYGSYNHDVGIDGIIKDVKEINGGYRASGFGIEFQLKSTWDVSFENGELVYDLEVKNYNDLVSWEGGNPAILILFVMPSDENQWLDFSNEQLVIRQCAWWCSLKGLPVTDNEHTKRIRIPETQVFSPVELERLMSEVRRCGTL